jgi:serine/threonine protein kinase
VLNPNICLCHSRNTTTRDVVAVKVIDIDEADYRAHGEEKDEQIRAFQKEIKILRQAQASGAPNLNQMIEALPVHSQLWLVCEYCPGGSVKTLVSRSLYIHSSRSLLSCTFVLAPCEAFLLVSLAKTACLLDREDV